MAKDRALGTQSLKVSQRKEEEPSQEGILRRSRQKKKRHERNGFQEESGHTCPVKGKLKSAH